MVGPERDRRLMTGIARLGALATIAVGCVIAYRTKSAWAHLSPTNQETEKLGFSLIWFTIGASILGSLQLLRLGAVSSRLVLGFRLLFVFLAIILMWGFDSMVRNLSLVGSGA